MNQKKLRIFRKLVGLKTFREMEGKMYEGIQMIDQ